MTIPGYMVWAAIGYAAAGSLLTWLVGRPLINAHTQLRAEEANFRFALVRLSESSNEIALYRGEAAERDSLNLPVEAVLSTMRHIANRLAALTWVTGGYGWLALLVPLLLAAPGYFGGTLSLGGLMMVVGAFYQVQQALRWYVDRFPTIAEWRAMFDRVIGYREVLEKLHSIGAGFGRIRYVSNRAGILAFEDLCVFAPNGNISLSEKSLEIRHGERVLISATPKSGKSIFLKAIAGLWVWGRGIVRIPPHERMIFMPQVPYVPLGSLRSALTYPDAPGYYSENDIRAVLTRVQLAQYVAVMNETRRWDRELTLDEQHRLVLGRILLHRPQWVIQDESMSELDDESRKLALSIFGAELANTAVVSIGRHDPSHGFYQRTLNLQTRLPGLRLPLQSETPGDGRVKAGAAH